MKDDDVTVTVSGRSGVGKSTLATLIQRYLKTLGFSASIRLTDNEMPQCPADLRKSTIGLLNNKTHICVVEKTTPRENIKGDA